MSGVRFPRFSLRSSDLDITMTQRPKSGDRFCRCGESALESRGLYYVIELMIDRQRTRTNQECHATFLAVNCADTLGWLAAP
jgi:hypothetical protein